MDTVIIVLQAVTLLISLASLVLVVRKPRTKTVVTREIVEKMPERETPASPITYNAEAHTYELEGNLVIIGSLACLKKGTKQI